MNPLVSICVPTWNGETYLQDMLASIEVQTYPCCEVVVSDDASSDRTVDLIKEYAKNSRYPVRTLNHNPVGIAANWNHCVENAKGEFIKFLLQDDVLEPTCIEKMVEAAVNPSIGFVFCKRHIIPSTAPVSDHVRDVTARWHRLQPVQKGTELLGNPAFMEYSNMIGEPTCVMIRRNIMQTVGPFNSDYRHLLDVEYWIRCMMVTYVALIPEPLCSFRVHADQATLKNKESGLSAREARKLRAWILNSEISENLSNRVRRKLRFDETLHCNLRYHVRRILRRK